MNIAKCAKKVELGKVLQKRLKRVVPQIYHSAYSIIADIVWNNKLCIIYFYILLLRLPQAVF